MVRLNEDEALLGIVRGADPTSVKEVIAVMRQIDETLPDADGLKWFNRLYLMVTQKVDETAGWADPEWLLRLDVVFAGFYFRALRKWLEGAQDVPVAWRELMEARRSAGVEPIQFALAGMNAHINHDLALALIAVGKPVENRELAARRQDYEAVNTLLAEVEPGALRMLSADALGHLAEDTGRMGRVIGMWSVREARDLAWRFHLELLHLQGLTRTAAIEAQAAATGLLGKALLAG